MSGAHYEGEVDVLLDLKVQLDAEDVAKVHALAARLLRAEAEVERLRMDPASLCACSQCMRLGRGLVMLYRDQECPTCSALGVDDAERSAVAELGARKEAAEQRAARLEAEVERLTRDRDHWKQGHDAAEASSRRLLAEVTEAQERCAHWFKLCTEQRDVIRNLRADLLRARGPR